MLTPPVQRRLSAGLAFVVLAVALWLWLGVTMARAVEPVPCHAAGSGRYDCTFYVSGDGKTGGAPVQASDGSRVGYLHKGVNWVTCDEVGGEVDDGGYHNDHWGWTQSDYGGWGWVNAVYASGGSNDGGFGGGVPACHGAHGHPPGLVHEDLVPCRSSGGGHNDCFWYPSGDGSSAGTPVQGADRHVVGYLHQGSNWIVCQARGGEVSSGSYHNDWWGWTVADDGRTGWANAVYASGGGDDSGFAGAPACNGAHGSPPSGHPILTIPPPTRPLPPLAGGGSTRTRILHLAISQKGYEDDGTDGPQNNKYGPAGPWCSNFVTWVWSHSGVDIPILPFSGDVYAWALRHTYTLSPQQRPTAGDAVEFGDTSVPEPWTVFAASDHVGLVYQVFHSGRIVVVNGNFASPDGNSSVQVIGPYGPADAADASGSGYPIYGYASPVPAASSASIRTHGHGSAPVPRLPRDELAAAVRAQRAGFGRGRGGPSTAPLAYLAMPYHRHGLALHAVDATGKGRIVVRARYRGSRRHARRVFHRFVHRHHDRARRYVVRYRRVHRHR